MSAIYKDGTYYGTGGGSSYTAGEGINIENDEISVDTMTAEDLQDVKDAFTPNTGTPMRMFNYSTEEQIVGQWIDGKPLYQRTIQVLGTFSGMDVSIADLTSWNMKTIISVSGSGSAATDNLWNPLEHAHPTVSWAKTCYISEGRILICTGSNALFVNPIFTIQYTKTTD